MIEDLFTCEKYSLVASDKFIITATYLSEGSSYKHRRKMYNVYDIGVRTGLNGNTKGNLQKSRILFMYVLWKRNRFVNVRINAHLNAVKIHSLLKYSGCLLTYLLGIAFSGRYSTEEKSVAALLPSNLMYLATWPNLCQRYSTKDRVWQLSMRKWWRKEAHDSSDLFRIGFGLCWTRSFSTLCRPFKIPLVAFSHLSFPLLSRCPTKLREPLYGTDGHLERSRDSASRDTLRESRHEARSQRLSFFVIVHNHPTVLLHTVKRCICQKSRSTSHVSYVDTVYRI